MEVARSRRTAVTNHDGARWHYDDVVMSGCDISCRLCRQESISDEIKVDE
ncbi:predicted protein [Arabidopsis lyrata subsp. lyrata]|uniref:Predicted protein n=1 Tax=Arabidopsis lyrata subsp. lyrata TaxID=81972 RepID=D7MIB6_ARALL|nr:predicted protein [Arabidopsis lyrata subsp. lyrata]